MLFVHCLILVTILPSGTERKQRTMPGAGKHRGYWNLTLKIGRNQCCVMKCRLWAWEVLPPTARRKTNQSKQGAQQRKLFHCVPLDSAQPCRCMPRCVLPASSAISNNLTKWFNQGQSRRPRRCWADGRCSPLCGAHCKFPWVPALLPPWLIVSSQSAPHPQPPDDFFSPDVYLHISIILPTWMNLVVSWVSGKLRISWVPVYSDLVSQHCMSIHTHLRLFQKVQGKGEFKCTFSFVPKLL